MSKVERKALMDRVMKHLINFYNHVWLYLEIHMEKIIFASIMLLCVSEVSLKSLYPLHNYFIIPQQNCHFLLQVCAIHLLFVITVVIAINLRRGLQIIAIKVMAAVIAMLMVTKMIYQIKYIKHDEWNVNCTVNVLFIRSLGQTL